MLNKEKESKIGNGFILFGNDGLFLEMSESLNFLVLNFKLFVFKIFWRNVRDLFIKFLDYFL